MRAVRAALDDLAAGEPRLLLIEGPAGIGKTRLLTEARRIAGERSVRVLTARGSQLEKAFGFGAVRQLFEPELALAERRDALLAGSAASARTVFDLAPGESPDGSFAVLHGLYWLAVNLSADGPLVLAVDDLQWCDSASLRWLAYLVRRLDAVPVLVVGTVRTGEQHVDEELLTELSLEPVAAVVRPAALSPEATTDLVERRLGGPVSPLFAVACHRTTSGNPLLLRQLLRGLEADAVRPDAAHADVVVAVGSRAVSSMVLMRLRRLPELGGRRGAGRPPSSGTAPRCRSSPGSPGSPRPRPPPGWPRSPAARSSRTSSRWPSCTRWCGTPSTATCPRPSARCATSGRRRCCGPPGRADEQVAAHLLLAPSRGDPATVEVLRRAARTAADRGASDSAVTLLRRALAELPAGELRCDVLTELGMIESLIDGAASTEHLLQAYALTEDPRSRATIAVAIARTEVFASPPGVATAFAREAAAGLPPELADHRQALLAIERTGGYMHGLERERVGADGSAGAGRDRARRPDAGRDRSPSRR